MTDSGSPSYEAAIRNTMNRTYVAVNELGTLAHMCIESGENEEATRLLGKVEGIELLLRYLEEELVQEGFNTN